MPYCGFLSISLAGTQSIRHDELLDCLVGNARPTVTRRPPLDTTYADRRVQ